MSHQRMPAIVLEIRRASLVLSQQVRIPLVQTVRHDGLYIAMRSKRDKGYTSRKIKYLSVRVKRNGEEIFRSEEGLHTFPTDYLIAQLMLIS